MPEDVTLKRCEICGGEFRCSDGVFVGTECSAPMTFYCWPCYKKEPDSQLLKDQDPASPYWPYG